MNYETMTIESLSEYCFNKSGYAINKDDLMCRIEHLCRAYHNERMQANEVNQGTPSASPIQNVVGSDSDGLINPTDCPFRANGFCTA